MEETAEMNAALATTLSSVRTFHAEGKYSDVQIQVGSELFNCQRSLFAAVSEYFDVMFSSNFKESTVLSNDQPIILNEIDAAAFEEILCFIYTGGVRVNDSNVHHLLFMNDFLRLRTARIKECCVKYLESRCQKPEPMSNALHLFSFASMKADYIIVDILNAHICQHFHHYSNDAQLVEFDFKSLNALLNFGKSYILPLPGSQNVLLKIIHIWVNHDRKERSKSRFALMINIDFANISPEYAMSIVNRLENVADEVVNHSEDTKSALAELDKLRMGVEIDSFNTGDARPYETISLYVFDPSELKINDTVYSSSKRISNLSWKIRFKRVSKSYFSIYLHCDVKSEISSWNCYASCTFTLRNRSLETGQEDHVRELSCCSRYSSVDSRCFGIEKFISREDLMDPKNGYIAKKNAIQIDACVSADVLFRPI